MTLKSSLLLLRALSSWRKICSQFAIALLWLTSAVVAAQDQPAGGSLSDAHAAMKQAQDRLAAGDTGRQTQDKQQAAADILGALIEAAKAREASSQSASGSGQSQQPSQANQSASQSQSQSTPGNQPGTGSNQDIPPIAERALRSAPQSPWSNLRDRQRDPVYNAIQQRFPARYQQLLEQYYKSFQGARERSADR